MFYLVYKITNIVNGHVYIGAHKTHDINDSYIGSGSILRKAINKYGKHCFTKEILFKLDTEELMYAKERELVNEEFISKSTTYNAKLGGIGGFSHIKTNEYRSKGGQSLSKRMDEDPEFKNRVHQKISNTRKKNILEHGHHWTGVNHTVESRDKISRSMKGKNSGSNNGSYGTCWIHSISECKNKKINKNDIDVWLSKGWIVGRKMKF